MRPCDVSQVKVQSTGRVGNVIVGMVIADVQGHGQSAVTLKTSAFIVTFQAVLTTSGVRYANTSVAFDFLLLALTVTCNHHPKWTRLLLFARRWSMTWLFTRMTTQLLRFTALLLAMGVGILAIARSMTSFRTTMRTAFEKSATDQTTQDFGSPTRLVLECLFIAKTFLFSKKWALRTLLFVGVTIVDNLRMPTTLGLVTWEVAWRRPSSTGQRCLEGCSSAAAGNVVKNGVPTAATRAFMAKLLACMVATFQRSAANPCANVFRLHTFVDRSHSCTQGFQLALCSLPLNSFAFTSTTVLTAFMPPTVQSSFTDPETLRRLFDTSIAGFLELLSPTSAGGRDLNEARRALPNMTGFETWMTALLDPSTRFVTARNWVCTRCSAVKSQLRQGRLSTWTIYDHIG